MKLYGIPVRVLLVSALCAAAPAASVSAQVPAAPALSDSVRVRRIAKLAEVWGEIRYHHPWLAYKSIDWDSALVSALPMAEAARDSVTYARAVAAMIGKIADPATRLLPEREAPAPDPDMRPFAAWRGPVLVLNFAASASPGFVLETELRSLTGEIPKAKSVVMDLRFRRGTGGWPYTLLTVIRRVLPLVFTGELRLPASRYVTYSGYPSQDDTGGYTLGFTTHAAKIWTGTPGVKPKRIVFLFDDLSPIPPAALALKQRGLASIVCEGKLNDAAVVETTLLDAGEGVRVESRLEELDCPFEIDHSLPAHRAAEAKDVGLEKALELARAGSARVPSKPTAESSFPVAVWRPDKAYSDQPYPDRAHRQLAAIRLWNVIRVFYPYQKLLDESWAGALERFLPRFESARDAREYAAAVLEMSSTVRDGHTGVSGGKVPELIGAGSIPALDVLEIEGKPVVVRVGPTAAKAGVRPGDIVEAIDGEPILERIERLKCYVAGATPAALKLRLIRAAMGGADSSTLSLRVAGASGPKEVSLLRSGKELREMRTGVAPFAVLRDNIGYVVMERLRVDEVDSMFLKLQDTQAIIFDMRGYPNGTAWPIAPHINTRHAVVGALFERALVSGSSPARYKFEQELPSRDVPLYRGRTLMLIDERAQSQAEHTCLFFEAANGTTFVGSPTSGSNGDVTRMTLPGGLSVMFTGHDVRHADGRQLQRIGIQPDVPVRPTIAGLRAGRDEVLERALAVVERKAGPGQ